MSEWKEYKLKSFAEVQNGYAFKASDFAKHGVPIIKIKNIQPPNISFEDAQYFNGQIDNRLKQFFIFKKDILISMTGSHVSQISSAVGKVGRYGFDSPALLNQRVGKIYSNDETKLNNDYLYYLIARPEVQFELATNAGGSANQANISPQNIKNLEFKIPDIKTQSRIASILSSLDDKIELNRRMNQTLEQMSQALFNHYFVDNIDPDNLPEGWRNGKIKQIAKSNLKTLSKSDILLKIDYVEISEVNRGSIGNITTYVRGKEPSRARRILSHGDTVMSTVRPDRGAYFLAINPYKELIVSTGFAVFSPFEVPYTFLFLLLTQPDLIKYYGFVANGAAYPSISAETICDMDIVLPEKELLEEFHKKVEPLLLNFNLNINESKILSNIRDTLLPKLMSGEIDVETLMKEEELIPNELVENLKTA